LTGVGLAADFECEILGVGFDADRWLLVRTRW
jgi:hypothetical protein